MYTDASRNLVDVLDSVKGGWGARDAELGEGEEGCGEREVEEVGKCEICAGEIQTGFEDNHSCLRGLEPQAPNTPKPLLAMFKRGEESPYKRTCTERAQTVQQYFVDIETLVDQFDTKIQSLPVADEDGLRAEDEFPPDEELDHFFE